MAIAIVDLPKHRLADVLDRLVSSIRELEAENKLLKEKMARMDRKALHGCYDANCSMCDNQ